MTHEIVSLSTIVALVVHAVTLLGDKFLHPSVLDITVPFASSYKTVWMSLGILGGWGAHPPRHLLLRAPHDRRQAWRKLHRFTALAWLAGRRPRGRHGHRCGPDLVPRDDRDRRDPGCRSPAPAPRRHRCATDASSGRRRGPGRHRAVRAAAAPPGARGCSAAAGTGADPPVAEPARAATGSQVAGVAHAAPAHRSSPPAGGKYLAKPPSQIRSWRKTPAHRCILHSDSLDGRSLAKDSPRVR